MDVALPYDKRPRCPACGEPARNVILIGARVRCVLTNDGIPGRVLSVAGQDAAQATYECGGGHRFSV